MSDSEPPRGADRPSVLSRQEQGKAGRRATSVGERNNPREEPEPARSNHEAKPLRRAEIDVTKSFKGFDVDLPTGRFHRLQFLLAAAFGAQVVLHDLHRQRISL